jgi:CheY-like chemotaxis protein
MNKKQMNVLLADDDADDCFFFEKALKEIPIKTKLTIVRDGEQLMNYLLENSSSQDRTDIIFLDLSMPRKTGFECLQEIKENNRLKDIQVVMLSTSYPRDMAYEQGLIKTLNWIGAANFIRKIGDYAQIKDLLHNELIKVIEKRSMNEQEKK